MDIVSETKETPLTLAECRQGDIAQLATGDWVLVGDERHHQRQMHVATFAYGFHKTFPIEIMLDVGL